MQCSWASKQFDPRMPRSSFFRFLASRVKDAAMARNWLLVRLGSHHNGWAARAVAWFFEEFSAFQFQESEVDLSRIFLVLGCNRLYQSNI